MSKKKKKHAVSPSKRRPPIKTTTHTLFMNDDAGNSLRVHVEEDNVIHDYALGTVYIGNTAFHVECVAVKVDPDAPVSNKALNPEFQSRIDAIENEMQCACQPVSFDLRDWLIFITPHAA